ncbi:MAG: hypothetical protein ACQEXQ_07650 [Bacillota bacterium]
MPQPRPWLDEIIDAMKDLGVHGTLEDIYTRVSDRQVMDFSLNLAWKDRIRGTIYQYSLSSDAA